MTGNFTICVGTVGSGAWLSPDGGESWRRVGKGLGNESRVFGLTVHPKEPVPNEPPTVREAVRMIAQLGGFLARKHDGEPGVKTLWRGLRRLHDITLGWRRARARQPRDPTLLHVGNA